MNVEAAILARITKRAKIVLLGQRPADLGRPAVAGREAGDDRRDLARPAGVRLGARHRPRERRPQRAVALQLGALPGGARLRREGVDDAGPVPLGGRALPVPLREPVGAALPAAAPADLDPRRVSAATRSSGRPSTATRTSCSRPSSSRRASRSTTTTRWRARTATRPGRSTAATCSRSTSTRPRSWPTRPARRFLEGPTNSFLEGSQGNVNPVIQNLPGMTSRTDLLPTVSTFAAVARGTRIGSEPGRHGQAGRRQRARCDEQVEKMAIITGTPKTVMPKIRTVLETLRPGTIFFWDGDGAMNHDDAMRSLRLMGEEVLPAVREMGEELDLPGPFEVDPATTDEGRAEGRRGAGQARRVERDPTSSSSAAGRPGSTAATMLARRASPCTLFERERFPRAHIGESLLPATMPILEALGVLRGSRRGAASRSWAPRWCGAPARAVELVLPGDERAPSPRLPGVAARVRPDPARRTPRGRRHGSAKGPGAARPLRRRPGDRGPLTDETDGKRGSRRATSSTPAANRAGRPGARPAPRRPELPQPGGLRLLRGRRALARAGRDEHPRRVVRQGWFWDIPLHIGWMSVGAVVDADTGRTASPGGARRPSSPSRSTQRPDEGHARRARLVHGPSCPGLVVHLRPDRRRRLDPRRRRRLLHRPAVLLGRAPRDVRGMMAAAYVDSTSRRRAGRGGRARLPGALLRSSTTTSTSWRSCSTRATARSSRTSGRPAGSCATTP